MNIAICGLNNKAYKPEFKAGISNDAKTGELLNYAFSPLDCNKENYDNAEYLYCLNENLKRIKSDDIIRIYERDYSKVYVWRDGTEKDIFIHNPKTGAMTSLTEKNKNGKYSYSSSDIQVKDAIKNADNLAQALYYAIINKSSLGLLFGRKGAKKKAEFIEPNTGVLEKNITGLADMRNEIKAKSEIIQSYEAKLAELINERDTLVNKSNRTQLDYVRKSMEQKR